MISFIWPLLQEFKGSKWLTIGDGRFGLDSIRILQVEPTLNVLPTDISPDLLIKAKEKNIIRHYQIENAERLSFESDSFDFAFCKESYHHFPRPFIALYEMLRVARNAVVLIEPLDNIPMPLMERCFHVLKTWVKKIINRPLNHTDKWRYEESGNYVYSVSKREMQKAALGIGLPVMAYRCFNDCYQEGVEYEKCSQKSKLFRKIKSEIRRESMKNFLGISSPNMMVVIFFKTVPPDTVLNGLKKNKFHIDCLPKNPYI